MQWVRINNVDQHEADLAAIQFAQLCGRLQVPLKRWSGIGTKLDQDSLLLE